MRAPVSRSRPVWWRCGLPVLNHSCVGRFGLFSELALGLAHCVVVGVDPGGGAFVAFGAGHQLELAQLLGRQRRLGVGVVLTAREQTLEQTRELARGGDGCDVVAAAGADALVKRAQRAGLAHDGVRCLDQRLARLRAALLGDPAGPCRL